MITKSAFNRRKLQQPKQRKTCTLGGGRGGGTSHVKRGRFRGLLSMFLCGNSIILCVSISLYLSPIGRIIQTPIEYNRLEQSTNQKDWERI